MKTILTKSVMVITLSVVFFTGLGMAIPGTASALGCAFPRGAGVPPQCKNFADVRHPDPAALCIRQGGKPFWGTGCTDPIIQGSARYVKFQAMLKKALVKTKVKKAAAVKNRAMEE